MTYDCNGMTEGMRVVLCNVCEDDANPAPTGTIVWVCEHTSIACVDWDGASSSEVDVDELIPVGGW